MNISTTVFQMLSEKYGDRLVNRDTINDLNIMIDEMESYWQHLKPTQQAEVLPAKPKQELKSEDRCNWFTASSEEE